MVEQIIITLASLILGSVLTMCVTYFSQRMSSTAEKQKLVREKIEELYTLTIQMRTWLQTQLLLACKLEEITWHSDKPGWYVTDAATIAECPITTPIIPWLLPVSLPALPPANGGRQPHAFEQDLMQLCAPYVRASAPMHTLCERVERFLPELFVFVARSGVPSDNNLTERSLRPLVIARKISGDSRSPNGSQTRMALFSCFGTRVWAAQELNPFLQCLALLSQ